jgi:beta-glucosidase
MQPGFPTNNSDYTMLAAVSGGCDADCPGGAKPTQFFGGISHAVAAGVLPIEMVDRSLVRVFTAAIGLGLLDDPMLSPYAHLSDKDLDTPSTRQLNLEASLQSMVLLKNAPVNGKPVLPLTKGSKIAIIGPHFNSTQDLLSDYSPGHWWAHSPLMAAQAMAKAGEIMLAGSAQGCDLEGNSTAGFAAALALAKTPGVVPIVFVGLSPNNDPKNSGTPPVSADNSALESEGHDRTDINLQGQQEPLIKALYAANPRTVVVLIHGGALDITWAKNNVNAILDAHYPGQMGGDAILQTLLNYQGAAPAGRLTTTAYQQEFTARPMSDMSLRNITYKHYTGEVCYPFGFGLSYSQFNVQWTNATSINQKVGTDEMLASHSEYFVARARGDHTWTSPASYSATIKNVGKIASDYVLLGFVSSPARIAMDPAEPLRELFDFARVSLLPGASTTVHLSLPASVLSHVDSHGDERIIAGNYKIELGGERLGDSTALESTLTVTGPAQTLFSMTEVRAKYDHK